MESSPQSPLALLCPHCSSEIQVTTEEIVREYFDGIVRLHKACGMELQWWSVVRWNFRNFTGVFALIDAQASTIVITIRPGQRVALILTNHGIPADARILDIEYSVPYGTLFPLEERRGSPYRGYHEIPKQIELYPVPFAGLSEPPSDTRVIIDVYWAPHAADNAALQQLITASERYYQQQYNEVIIPANVAVESALGQLLTEFLRSKGIGRDKVESFLQDAATYSYQLNILLRLFNTLLGTPPLPENVVALLNQLRNHRNDLAHRGRPESTIPANDMADMLLASLVTYHYILLVLRPAWLKPPKQAN